MKQLRIYKKSSEPSFWDFLMFHKRHLRADSLSLLLSALRPRLWGTGRENKRLNKVFAQSIGLVLVGIFSFVFQNSYVSNASAASMTLTVPSAISVNVTPNGSLVKSSASSFSAKTDGAWGYNLSIKAKSTTDMVNGSAKLTTISKTMPESEYTAAGNNNTWGFIPSKLNNNANTSFIAATTSATTIEKTSAANASAVNNYNITLGAKADSTAVQGTYSNTLVMTLAANTVNYNITYNLNSGSWSGTSPQTGATSAGSIKLASEIPTREGYEFKGWCTVSTTDENCSGTTYQPGADYKLQNNSNDLILYAMYYSKGELLTRAVKVDSGVTSLNFKVGENIEMIMVAEQNSGGTDHYKPHYAFSGIDITGLPTVAGRTLVITIVPKPGYKLESLKKSGSGTQTWTATGVNGQYKFMKDITYAECTASEEGMNVTDERNNISYTIGKMSDKCFMFSNLRLAPGATLNPVTSAVVSNFTLPSTWTYSRNSAAALACKGTAGYNASGTGGNCSQQSKGVTEYYYNWFAAIANPNSGTGGDPTPEEDGKTLGSICPKNWRLPTGNGPNEGATFASTWNIDKSINPGRFAAFGRIRSSSQLMQLGSYGYWWSSSSYNNGSARTFDLRNGTAANGYYEKDNGHPVRCVLST